MSVRVGISLRVVTAGGYREDRDAISQDWIYYLDRHRIIPVLIPNTLSNPGAFLDTIAVSAFLLSNGNNVGPQPSEGNELSVEDVSADRDLTERKIISFAIEKHIPLLGVCRGMQMLNVYFGGTIVRELDDYCGRSRGHVATCHEVGIINPRYVEVLGVSKLTVNSFHGQGVTVETLSPSLRAFAVTEEGVVEGLCHPELPIMGIQWHPERPDAPTGVDEILLDHWLSGKVPICI